MWNCLTNGGKEFEEKAGWAIRVKKTETMLRGRLSVKYEQVYDSCRVIRGSLGAICNVCVLPL